jgi:hypothetical protein
MNDINMGSTVLLRGEGGYRVTALSQIEGKVVYVHIARDGAEEPMFAGSPSDAAALGFEFHQPADETILLQLGAAVEEVAVLRHELDRANERVEEFRQREAVAKRALTEFRDEVRTAVIDAQQTHDLCREGTNTFLESLGLEPLAKKWTGVVTRDSDDQVVLTVSGIEADTESEAESMLENNFSVTATVKSVYFNYEYTGDGDEDWEESEFEDDDYDEEDSEFADAHHDGFTFTVSEEE